MVCYHPITLYMRKAYPIDTMKNWTEQQIKDMNKAKLKYYPNSYEIKVPCNKCIGCKLDHAKMWADRVYCEFKEWNCGYFITFTYNNEHLPINKNGIPTLVKRDMQLLLKKLRNHYKGVHEWINPRTDKIERPLRVFYCGEYGPKGGRPHYHMCIMNLNIDDLEIAHYSKTKDKQGNAYPIYKSKKLYKLWGKGFCAIAPLNYETACYTARYVQKKAYQPTEKREKDEFGKIIKKEKIKEDEFIEMSRCPGIGYKYFQDHKKDIFKNQGIIIANSKGTSVHKVPRYAKKIYEKDDWETAEQFKFDCAKSGEKQFNEMLKLYDINVPTEYHKIKQVLEMQEKITLEKAKRLKRDNIT